MTKLSKSAKDQKTKRLIQNILKQEGAMAAGQLSEKLGITAMAVRQHLYTLAEDKLVEYDELPRPKGRPAKFWKLSNEANKLFPDAHAELSISLIDSMKAVFGEAGLQKLIEQRSAEQLAQHKAAIDKCSTTEEKLAAFTRARSDEGYMAQFEKNSDGSFTFVENHCPICAAATACSNLCAMELDIIRALFPDQQITREDHILLGARRCAYRIV